MSSQRTPPNFCETKLSKNITPHHSSDPALNETRKVDESLNIVRRNYKRGIDYDHSECFEKFMCQMKSMFVDFQEKQNAKFDIINQSINCIKELHLELKESVKFISKKYDESLVIIDHLQQENKNIKKQVQFLEQKLDHHEKSARASILEVRHVPKGELETKDSLVKVIQDLGAAVNVPSNVVEAEIRDIYRANSKTDAIVVEFTTVARKTAFISSFIHFNKIQREQKQLPLNTNHLKIKGPPRNIYISDSLTGRTRRLFYLARQCAKTRSYNGCWISFGRVFLRKSEGDKPIQIKDEGDLDLNKL